MVELQIAPPVSLEEAQRQCLEWVARMADAGVPPNTLWRHVRFWRDDGEVRTALTWPAQTGLGRFTLDMSSNPGDFPVEAPYIVEVFGTELTGPLTPPYLVLRNLVFWVSTRGGGAVRSERDMAIRVWRETARYEGSRVYLDRRWNRNGEQEWLVRADKGTSPPTLDEAAVALRAASMLTKIVDPGRDIGFNVEPKDEVIRILQEAVARLRQDGLKFKVDTIVAHTPWERDAYYLRVNRYAITKDHLRRWYYESPTKAPPQGEGN